jgi:hypothetical protein
MLKDKPLLDPVRAIELIRQQLGKSVENLPFDDPQLYRWWNTTRNVIQEAFGANHSNVFEFSSTSPANSPGQSQSDHAANIRQRKALLEGFIEQLGLYRPTGAAVAVAVEAAKFDNKQAVAERAARRQAVVMPILAKKHWRPGRLATEAGVSKNSVYGYLDGTRFRISDANRTAIAETLGIEPHQLLD